MAEWYARIVSAFKGKFKYRIDIPKVKCVKLSLGYGSGHGIGVRDEDFWVIVPVALMEQVAMPELKRHKAKLEAKKKRYKLEMEKQIRSIEGLKKNSVYRRRFATQIKRAEAQIVKYRKHMKEMDKKIASLKPEQFMKGHGVRLAIR